MVDIFEHGAFAKYARCVRLEEALEGFDERSNEAYFSRPDNISVFISHKHDDIEQGEDVRGLIGLLKDKYNVDAYIDAKDGSMPIVTSAVTAKRTKDKIHRCDRFILLATEEAVESNWCNWELGFGDAVKGDKGRLALVWMKKRGSSYSGNEYMKLYPHICQDNDGDYIVKGGNIHKDMTLTNWLQ